MSGLHSSPRLSKQSFEVQQRLRSEDVTNLDLSKVLETIVIDQFLDYLDEYNILPPAQHGFRKSHSTVTALVKTIQKWTSQKGSAIASFDYSAAFDTISKDDDDVSMYLSDSFLNKSMLILQRPDQLGKGVFKKVITF